MIDLSQLIAALLLLIIGLTAGLAAAWWWSRKKAKPSIVAPSISSQITELRAVGELRVFKGVSKDIITHVDHSFGDFGKKYLSWAFTKKKLAMVFEFEMDFSYDLRSDQVLINNDVSALGARTIITLPPCKVGVSIKNLQFYDEQRAKFLPWLLPDLVQGFFEGRFSEEDKNQLIAAAKSHALAQATELFERYRPQVEQSGFLTLNAIAKSVGMHQLEIRYAQAAPVLVGTEDVSLLGPSQSPSGSI